MSPLLKLHPDVTTFQLNSKGAWATCFIKVKHPEQVQDDQRAQQCTGGIGALCSSVKISVTASSLTQAKSTPSNSPTPHKATVMPANLPALVPADVSITLLCASLMAQTDRQTGYWKSADCFFWGGGGFNERFSALLQCMTTALGEQCPWLNNHRKSLLRF